MSKLKFPDNFWWGGAISAEQVDGKSLNPLAKTAWDELFEKKPELFYQQVGPRETINFRQHYAEDLKLMAQIGINSLRHSFSWARLFPDGQNVDHQEVKFYHAFLNLASRLKIKIVVQMHHFDLPSWAQALGGWESQQVIAKFVAYCDFLFQEFGHQVDYFATFNEPVVSIAASYLWKWHPPLVDDPRRAMQAGFNFILAHAKVVNLFNDKYRRHLQSKIGFVGDLALAYPKDNLNFSAADGKSASDYNLIFLYAMHDAMILGKFPPGLKQLLISLNVLPTYAAKDLLEISKIKLDFIGINFYSPRRVGEGLKVGSFEEKIASPYEWSRARINVFRGWEIYPQALYEAMMIVKKRYYNLPFFIAENGMGVQQEWKYRDSQTQEIADDYRIAFIKEHLEVVHQAISDGANCFGYHLWSAIDCWSFQNGFKNTYGLIEVDLQDHLKRRFKKSAHFYHHLIKDNGFDNQYQKIEDFFDLANIAYEKSI